jgi:putative hydrolase of the HAD superfamily
MIKAILLDADGVTLKDQEYFAESYSKKHNLAPEPIRLFFKEKFGQCQKGQLDLKQEIQPYLKNWGYTGTVDEYLNKWFTGGAIADEEVLALVKTIRKSGTKCYLATDQEKYRAEYINTKLNFSQLFDGTFYSCNLGHQKSEQEYFNKIATELNLNPEEIAYWDDDEANVQIAQATGIKSYFYTDIEKFKEELATLN